MGHTSLFVHDFVEKYHSLVRHSVGHLLIQCSALQGVDLALGRHLAKLLRGKRPKTPTHQSS